MMLSRRYKLAYEIGGKEVRPDPLDAAYMTRRAARRAAELAQSRTWRAKPRGVMWPSVRWYAYDARTGRAIDA